MVTGLCAQLGIRTPSAGAVERDRRNEHNGNTHTHFSSHRRLDLRRLVLLPREDREGAIVKELLDRISELERENERLKHSGSRQKELQKKVETLEERLEKYEKVQEAYWALNVALGDMNESWSELHAAVCELK